MRVEIIALPECPNLRRACELVHAALAGEGARADVMVTVLNGRDTDAADRFAGSPTILVNGRDVEPDEALGHCCRLYGNGRGVPAMESVTRAIRAACAPEAE